MQKSCTEPKKNKLIIIGASPKLNSSQNMSFKTKYKNAINKLAKEKPKPKKVISLKGTLECFTIPTMALSYSV